MKRRYLLIITISLSVLTLLTMEKQMEAQNRKQKILIAYFSWSGNTRAIAQQIHQKTGGDLFEIEPVKSYSQNYNTCLEEAQRDQRSRYALP